MSVPSTAEQLLAGDAALAMGEWERARDLYVELDAMADVPSVSVLDGLAESQWWLGDVDAAIAARQRAYRLARADGEPVRAVWLALWLCREFEQAVGNSSASRGWLARADTLLEGLDDPGADGWASLTRASRSRNAARRLEHGEAALTSARAAADTDLEVLALGQIGLGRCELGDFDEGLIQFEEAMATAIGESAGLRTIGELCCQMTQAAELVGDMERFAQWNAVVQKYAFEHRYPPLVAFCATCCAVAFSSQGQWDIAEQELRNALDHLATTGHRSRCLPPAARLAELCILQDRLDEAEVLLGDDDADEMLLSRAQLALARGEPGAAVLAAQRFVRRMGGDSLLTAGALALQADAQLARGDLRRASAMARRLEAVAARTGDRRTRGRAALVRGLVAAAGGRDRVAVAQFEDALDHLSAAPGSAEVARAHLALAEVLEHSEPDSARSEARAALAAFEAAGANRLADAAAQLLRRLGDRSRVGAKGVGELTGREREVLRLVAHGLTNGEIAARLYISVKTAGNHVSNILGKLGVRTRTEAATLAARNGLLGRS